MSAELGYATLSIVASAGSPVSSADLIAPSMVTDLGARGSRGGSAHGAELLAGASRAIAPLALASAVVGGVIGVAGWGKAQVEALGRIEQINAQTASVIKSTGNAANVTADGVEALAGKLEALTGTEAESIQEGANLLLTFKNIRNEAGAGNDIFDQTTTAMVDMARAMGTDASSGALQLGKALNDPVAGIAALSRVGITFSDDQKNLIKTMVETGDIMGAQKLILGELNSQFGGSGAAYAQTYAGKIDLLGHAWGTFGETLFSGVMPALGTAAVFLTRVIEVATGVVDVLFNGNFDGGLFAALGVTEDDGLIAFLFSVRDVVTDLWGAIASGSPAGVGGIFVGLIEGAASGGAQVRAVVFDALSVVAATVLAVAPALASAAGLIFASLVDGAVQLLPHLTTAVLAVLPALVSAITVAAAGLLSAAVVLLRGLVTAATTALPVVLAALLGVAPSLTTTLVAMLPGLAEAALTLFTGLLTAFAQAHAAIIGAVLDLLPQLVTAIIEMLPMLVGASVELFLGLVLGLVDAAPPVIRAVLELLPSLVTSLARVVPVLVDAAISLFQSLATTVPIMLPQLVGALAQIGGALVGVVASLAGALVQAGIDIVAGLVRGLMDSAGGVVDMLLGIAGNAVDAFKDFFGIKSPSRLLMGFGEAVGDSLVERLDRVPVGALVDLRGGQEAPTPQPPGNWHLDVPEGGFAAVLVDRMRLPEQPDHITLVDSDGTKLARMSARYEHAA